jgi:hypothetical protein
MLPGGALLLSEVGFPVTSAPMTLFSGLVTRQGPKRALSSPPPISTQADCGVTPKGRVRRRYVGSKAKTNRSASISMQMMLDGADPLEHLHLQTL